MVPGIRDAPALVARPRHAASRIPAGSGLAGLLARLAAQEDRVRDLRVERWAAACASGEPAAQLEGARELARARERLETVVIDADGQDMSPVRQAHHLFG